MIFKKLLLIIKENYDFFRVYKICLGYKSKKVFNLEYLGKSFFREILQFLNMIYYIQYQEFELEFYGVMMVLEDFLN